MKYTVIIPFCGAINKEVEADSEEQAIEVVLSGEVDISDNEFAESAEIDKPYILKDQHKEENPNG